MRPGIVVQARMSSRRLPGKALADVAGEPLLARVVARARLATEVAFVGVATSTDASDDAIASFCRARDIPCFRGPLDDVLGRLVGAARHWDLDPVVRITGDCPFASPELVDELVRALRAHGADAARLDGATLHEGIDPFSRRALEAWDALDLALDEREHLALLPDRRRDGVRVYARPVRDDERARPGLRLCVDEPHQLAFARAAFAALGGRSDFATAELVAWLDARSRAETGADLVACAIAREGVERLHLYPGGTIMPTLNAWIARGGDFVVARHEQGAGYAALAEARLAGAPRVAMVTSGPGVTNLVTVIADAYYDATPFVAIAGQVGTGDLLAARDVRQRGFQEVPTSQLCAPIAKACLRPMRADEAGAAIEGAFAIAREGRPGPVVVELPMDVQRAALAEPLQASSSSRSRASAAPDRARDAAAPDEASAHAIRVAAPAANAVYDEIAAWLRTAERPLVLAGQGVLQANAAGALRALAERERIPVATSLLGVGAIPSDHELALGYVGHTGTAWANRALDSCDALLVVGARLDVRQTGTRTERFASGARIARIDVDAGELAAPRVRTDVAVRADAAVALDALAGALARSPHARAAREAFERDVKTWRRELPLDDYAAGEGCHPAALLRALDDATRGDELVVVTGVGHHQQWAARHLTFDAPRRRLLTSGGHGAMGYDVPSAVGACLARPGTRVLCVVGDGSLQINAQELATLVERRLPAKIALLDNRRLAMVSQFQKLTWGHDPSTGDRSALDFGALARAYGMAAFALDRTSRDPSARAEADDAARAVLDAFLAEPGPALLWARIDPGCEVSPMLLAGQTLDAMWPWSAP